MAAKTYLAFDYGIRRIGVAVGQTISQSATALSILMVKNGRPQSEQLDRLVEDWHPAGFVLGLPAEPKTQGPINIARRVRSFAAYLTRRYHKPCFFIDERLSSRVIKDREYGGHRENRENRENKSHKGHIDSLVAQALLNDWLAQSPQNAPANPATLDETL